MIIGKVMSRVVSTRKYDELQGFKFLVVQSLYSETKDYFIAADEVGAGEGELVMITRGEACQHALSRKAPVDAIIVGIIDREPEFEG